MAIDSQLYELLAAANSQDSGALADAKGAAGALSALFSGYRQQGQYNREQKIKDMLDQPVPKKTLKRIFGSDSMPMSFGGLKELSSSGVASLLKDPNADLRTVALLSSGGDEAKASKLMKIFSDDEQGDSIGMSPASISAAKLLTPKEIKGNSSVPELRAVQASLQAELKGDIPEARRQLVQENLDMITSRLAGLGGVRLKKTPTVAPKAAPGKSAGLSAEEAAAIKALSDSLSK